MYVTLRRRTHTAASCQSTERRVVTHTSRLEKALHVPEVRKANRCGGEFREQLLSTEKQFEMFVRCHLNDQPQRSSSSINASVQLRHTGHTYHGLTNRLQEAGVRVLGDVMQTGVRARAQYLFTG